MQRDERRHLTLAFGILRHMPSAYTSAHKKITYTYITHIYTQHAYPYTVYTAAWGAKFESP